MTTIRKHYSSAFKAEIVREVLKGDQTINQIASLKGVHPNLVSKWKNAALKALPHAFDDDEATQTNSNLHSQIEALKAAHEKEKEALYAEIGKLSTELGWLKKKCATALAEVEQTRPGRVRK